MNIRSEYCRDCGNTLCICADILTDAKKPSLSSRLPARPKCSQCGVESLTGSVHETSCPEMKPDAPMEWTIVDHTDNSGLTVHEGYSFPKDYAANTFHVIEYSALDHMANCFAAEQDKRLSAEKERDALSARVAEMKVKDFDREELLNAYKANDKETGPLIARLIVERDAAKDRVAELEVYAQKDAEKNVALADLEIELTKAQAEIERLNREWPLEMDGAIKSYSARIKHFEQFHASDKCQRMIDDLVAREAALVSALTEAMPLIEDKSFGFIGEAFAQHCRNILKSHKGEVSR